MKTETLIDVLARGAGPAPRAVAARRLWPAAAVGLLASAAMALTLFGSIPAAMYATPAPWIKLAYAAALALAAGWLTARLSRPVARLSWPSRALLAAVVVMAALGAWTVLAAGPTERLAALVGETWRSCAWNVLAFSMPALGGVLWAVRGLAPTRPRAAGFAAGLLAGAVGALGYALACPEVSPAFVAVWYSLGIALTGVFGAVLGPHVLRW
ncbi:MAG: DUF1109 domain-containing protein [Methylibium sp.]|nr:DUF1109 domain-containing protein [Methylibium sp.]